MIHLVEHKNHHTNKKLICTGGWNLAHYSGIQSCHRDKYQFTQLQSNCVTTIALHFRSGVWRVLSLYKAMTSDKIILQCIILLSDLACVFAGVCARIYLQRRELSSVTRRCSARQRQSADPCSVGGWNESGSLGSPPLPAPAHATKYLTWHDDENHLWRPVLSVLSALSYHDHQGYVCWPQSFKSFRPISGPPVVEGGTCNIEPTWSVNGQLPIDKVLVPFTLQHWDTEEREKENKETAKYHDILGHFLICCVSESEMRSSRFVSETVLWSKNTQSRGTQQSCISCYCTCKPNSTNRYTNVSDACCILSTTNTSKHQLV